MPPWLFFFYLPYLSSIHENFGTRDVEAEAGNGSGTFSVEVEAPKFYRFRFHLGGKNGGRKKLVLRSFGEERMEGA